MRCSHHINLFEMCHYLYNVAFLAFFWGGRFDIISRVLRLSDPNDVHDGTDILILGLFKFYVFLFCVTGAHHSVHPSRVQLCRFV